MQRTSRPHTALRWLYWPLGLVAGLLVTLGLFLALFDWNMVRGPIAREASTLSGRPIRLDGELRVHLLSWTPSAHVEGLKIGNPAWMQADGQLADVPTLNVSVKLLPLLFGDIELPLLDLERPKVSLFRDAQGRANWQSDPNRAKPFSLPPIQHFVVNAGSVNLADQKRRLTLASTIQSSEAEGGGGSFSLIGQGTINTQPFSLNFKGAPLLNVRRDRPYGFDADIRAGATRVIAKGALSRPFDFGDIDAQLNVQGSNFADLYDLTGLALPNTAPYRMTGHLARKGQHYDFDRVSGRVGGSDIEGEFDVDDASGRPNLHADLQSRSLDFKDLAPLFGGGARGATHTARSASQPAAAKNTSGRVIPDAALNVSRLRVMDAVVRYRAASVTASAHLPLRAVVLNVTLRQGVLTISPISFAFPQGELAGMVRIDARGDTAKDDIDLQLTNAHIENFVGARAPPPVEGVLEARARLHGTGASVHEAAASADGDLTIVAPRGRIRRSLAELLGVDVVKGLGLYLAKDQSDTGVRCAVADFHAAGGRLSSRTLVIDTDPVQLTGQGEIDLRTERLNLTLQGHPKHFQLIRLRLPIQIDGSLGAPHIGPKPGTAIAQGAAATVLGALLVPPAALLAFVDPGLAKNADCGALVGQARALGAPVRLSQTTPSQAARRR